MKRLIYQVYLGEKNNLYDFCTESVKDYAKKNNIDHYLQTKPLLRIKPNPFSNGRSENATRKHGGFLPIYEKENAFGFIDDYDQIAIVDADIFIRPGSPNLFNNFGDKYPFGAVVERDMPLQPWYVEKIRNYSQMQYSTLRDVDWKWNRKGGEFYNMGLMVMNCELFKPYLLGQTPAEFFNRPEFQRFIDGVGAWKWSTDQTLLNWWVKKQNIPVKQLNWRWNGLFSANSNITECHFVHFFLRSKLPNKGNNIDELMMRI